jgi:hypothetical protein
MPSVGEESHYASVSDQRPGIAAAAHDGTIVLSRTAVLVGDDLPARLTLLGRGEQRLLESDSTEFLYQLSVD